MLTNDEIAAFFTDTPVTIQGNRSLREPQREGYAAAVAYFSNGGHRAVEQIPVGCGKTGLISILPFGIARGRVLVIAPNLTIRDQIADAVDITHAEGFYRSSGVLTNLSAGPYRAVLDADANLGDCDDAHIVVTNIHQLAERATRWLPNFAEDYFDLILIDEGHHNAAPSWQNVFERFPNARVLSLTATPFRADEQPVEGEHIYRYTFRQAMQRGYIKEMTSSNVAPSELYFTFRGDQYRHTLDEVLEMRENDWYSRGVALAPESNTSIVDHSIQWLRYLREGGLPHQLIAVACSVDHARQIRGLYQERGINAREIHSGQPAEERASILRDLRNGTLDAIVQVQMLGEGFDHPRLSVAAIFRPFRSLSPYIQFVGRAMRVNVQNAPGHPDNQGLIVSHVGLNIDRHWTDFKAIDRDDRDVVHGWLEAGEHEPEEGQGGEGVGRRRRLRPDMTVTQEVIDRFLSDPYLDPADDTLIDNAMNVLREQGVDLEALGLTREELQRRFVQARSRRIPDAPERLPVQPQAHRQMLRERLNEQTRSAANRICEALGEHRSGRRIAALGGTGATNNLAAVIVLMNRAVNLHLGIETNERRDQNAEALEQAIAVLDDIADRVQADIAERLGNGRP
ncbi:DEAD/DEAH box helicase family protein [Mycobacterium avium]|uniref:DEAD/DEAH box helicase n=1 Tax=Mycobacterium avium TaxID=1764 RepID=UPI001CDB272A|nr:DEAD/DEAH box helicase family protein [Mycobacterium avium]MCA2293010.1 DEAD/DEAH box helicase family protein [Mycobacterium avium]